MERFAAEKEKGWNQWKGGEEGREIAQA